MKIIKKIFHWIKYKNGNKHFIVKINDDKSQEYLSIMVEERFKMTPFYPELNHCIIFKEKYYIVVSIGHNYDTKEVVYFVKEIIRNEEKYLDWNCCPGCGNNWEKDSETFGCWFCGFVK